MIGGEPKSVRDQESPRHGGDQSQLVVEQLDELGLGRRTPELLPDQSDQGRSGEEHRAPEILDGRRVGGSDEGRGLVAESPGFAPMF